MQEICVLGAPGFVGLRTWHPYDSSVFGMLGVGLNVGCLADCELVYQSMANKCTMKPKELFSRSFRNEESCVYN